MSAVVIAVVGLRREAACVSGAGVVCITGGGDGIGLRRKLAEVAVAHTPRAVVSLGLGGALSPGLAVGDWVLAERIVNGARVWPTDERLREELRQALPSSRTGTIASGDVVVQDAVAKARLYAATGALAVDMESHVAAAFAEDERLPFIALRVISDAADRALPPAALVGMRPDGGLDLPAILWSLAKAPGQLPALMRTGREAGAAFDKLRLFGRDDRLGRLGVGDPDLGQLALDVV